MKKWLIRSVIGIACWCLIWALADLIAPGPVPFTAQFWRELVIGVLVAVTASVGLI